MSVELVELGEVVVTFRLFQRALENDAVANLWTSLKAHKMGHWGDLCDKDKARNDDALKNGGRLLSLYKAKDVEFWISTKADRSVTTLLLTEEY